MRRVAQQALFVLRAPDGARGVDHTQAAQVPAAGIGVQRLQHRLGEGLAHDRDAADAEPLHLVPELDGVEADRRQHGDGAAAGQRAEGGELRGRVHQRRRGQHQPHDRPLAPFRCAGALARLGGRLQRRQALEQVRAAAQHLEQVVLTPHHALGHTGGAAGVHE